MSPKDQEKIGKTYEAEDILHDIFYQLTRGFNELNRIENLTSWIYTKVGLAADALE